MIMVSVALVASILIGLWRVFQGPHLADRIAALQLTTTTGTALLMVLALLGEQRALLDVALVLALLSTLMTAALTHLLRSRPTHE
jgi:multicomponent Na+:H+ antiporter subunit F